MLKYLAAVVLMALGVAAMPAQAQAAPPTAVVSWSAVAVFNDNTPITGAVTYNIYQAVQGGPSSKVQTGLTGLSFTITAGVTRGTTQCFTVTASANGIEGAQFAPPVCAAIPFLPPGVPTQVTVVIH